MKNLLLGQNFSPSLKGQGSVLGSRGSRSAVKHLLLGQNFNPSLNGSWLQPTNTTPVSPGAQKAYEETVPQQSIRRTQTMRESATNACDWPIPVQGRCCQELPPERRHCPLRCPRRTEPDSSYWPAPLPSPHSRQTAPPTGGKKEQGRATMYQSIKCFHHLSDYLFFQCWLKQWVNSNMLHSRVNEWFVTVTKSGATRASSQRGLAVSMLLFHRKMDGPLFFQTRLWIKVTSGKFSKSLSLQTDLWWQNPT